jgi:hypothetical protein
LTSKNSRLQRTQLNVEMFCFGFVVFFCFGVFGGVNDFCSGSALLGDWCVGFEGFDCWGGTKRICGCWFSSESELSDEVLSVDAGETNMALEGAGREERELTGCGNLFDEGARGPEWAADGEEGTTWKLAELREETKRDGGGGEGRIFVLFFID